MTTTHYEQNQVAQAILNGSNEIFTSFKPSTKVADRVKLYNILNETEERLSDYIDQQIEVTDFIAYPTIVRSEVGPPNYQTRIILVSKDGKAYASVADGVYESLKKIIAIVGMAPWNGLRFTPVEKQTRNNQTTITLRLDA